MGVGACRGRRLRGCRGSGCCCDEAAAGPQVGCWAVSSPGRQVGAFTLDGCGRERCDERGFDACCLQVAAATRVFPALVRVFPALVREPVSLTLPGRPAEAGESVVLRATVNVPLKIPEPRDDETGTLAR